MPRVTEVLQMRHKTNYQVTGDKEGVAEEMTTGEGSGHPPCSHSPGFLLCSLQFSQADVPRQLHSDPVRHAVLVLFARTP